MTTDELKQAIVERMRSGGLVWETTHLAMPFLDVPGHVPMTEDAGYRRVLNACRALKDAGVLGRYTTTMNASVWWLTERVKP